MPLELVAAPGVEPVTRADAKTHCRVDADLTADDSLFDLLIGAARRYAEAYCGRSFISQQWRLTLDAFPGPSLMGIPYGVPYSLPGHAVLLERGPVISVDGIVYTATDGSTATLASAAYAVDKSGPLGRITPVFGQIWPVTLPQIGAVRITYTAGYGPTAADVPEGIRQWILMRVGTLYANREEVAILGRGKVDPLPFVDSLLDPYRVPLS